MYCSFLTKHSIKNLKILYTTPCTPQNCTLQRGDKTHVSPAAHIRLVEGASSCLHPAAATAAAAAAASNAAAADRAAAAAALYFLLAPSPFPAPSPHFYSIPTLAHTFTPAVIFSPFFKHTRCCRKS